MACAFWLFLLDAPFSTRNAAGLCPGHKPPPADVEVLTSALSFSHHACFQWKFLFFFWGGGEETNQI